MDVLSLKSRSFHRHTRDSDHQAESRKIWKKKSIRIIFHESFDTTSGTFLPKFSCNSKDHQPPKSAAQLHISPTRPFEPLQTFQPLRQMQQLRLCDWALVVLRIRVPKRFWEANFLLEEIRRENQLRLVVYPIIYWILYIQTVVGSGIFFHQQSHPKSPWPSKRLRLACEVGQKLCSVWCEAIHLKFGAKNALFKQLSQHAGLELPITLITPKKKKCHQKKGTFWIRSLPSPKIYMEWIISIGRLETQGWALLVCKSYTSG